jgi:heat-inducible transcriptional repressor
VARRIRRTIGPLDPRTQAILRAVIEEYVTTATPVGSQALVDRYGLAVSSATVRSILAELEHAGLLMHPHTSAGRVPTDVGYRYYVESIVETVPLPAVEQLMIRHQFGQVEFASEHWFRLAATTLASVTNSAGLATPAKPPSARVRRIDLVAIHDHLASLILVLREGTVKQVLVNLDKPIGQETLNEVARLLNQQLVDLTAAEIEAQLDRLASPRLVAAFESAPAADGSDVSIDEQIGLLGRRLAERIRRTMQEFDADQIEELFSDGLLNVMAAPEFAQSEKLRRVFVALENRSFLGSLVGSVAGSGRVQVFIGGENAAIEMREVSLVLAPYGRPGRAVGVVGVLGPTRMSYRHAIGTVRFVSGLMNELVDHLYA